MSSLPSLCCFLLYCHGSHSFQLYQCKCLCGCIQVIVMTWLKIKQGEKKHKPKTNKKTTTNIFSTGFKIHHFSELINRMKPKCNWGNIELWHRTWTNRWNFLIWFWCNSKCSCSSIPSELYILHTRWSGTLRENYDSVVKEHNNKSKYSFCWLWCMEFPSLIKKANENLRFMWHHTNTKTIYQQGQNM